MCIRDRGELESRYARQGVGGSADGREQWFNWIVLVADRPVGYVQATRPTGSRDAEIAWVIGIDWQGRGYATAAGRLMLAELACVGVQDVTACIHPDNVASEMVARHLGLRPTAEVVDGEIRWAGQVVERDEDA